MEEINGVKQIDVVAMNDVLQKDSDAQMIDVRRDDEVAEVAAYRTVHIPLDTFDPADVRRQLNLREDSPVYIICRSGGRSQRAAEALQASGLTNLTNVAGGTLAWVEAKLPLK